jgi:hypothetical protein
LHISRPDPTAVPGGIAVLDLALVDNGNSLKPTVRVGINAPRTVSGRE